MEIELMQPGEEGLVIDLVREVFDEIIAPGYTREGVDEFYNFARAQALARRSEQDHFTLVARKKDHVLGIIEIRDLNHVSMFFVRIPAQGGGVGKMLFQAALAEIIERGGPLNSLTVNASLNAQKAYEALGFVARGGPQTFNGIRFIPMERGPK